MPYIPDHVRGAREPLARSAEADAGWGGYKNANPCRLYMVAGSDMPGRRPPPECRFALHALCANAVDGFGEAFLGRTQGHADVPFAVGAEAGAGGGHDPAFLQERRGHFG